ncbi:MAG: DEAD/DEAH box helicase [Candidatus Daviesbacteria bacterium]|nr:MAG: DEAD/DEAH box helicase [Candidatus Daviesbacteria bacterium]
MINRPNGFRSSFRGANNNNRSFNRPFKRNGHFNQPKNRSFGAHESKLRGQVDIFIRRKASLIKKPTPILEEQQITPKAFTDFNLVNPLKVNILNKGFTTSTPIQTQAIEPILEGRDLIGLANTGTGKTAAFLIPIINKLFQERSQSVFIVAPTRELAIQINSEFRQLARGMPIYSCLCIGGANMRRQINELRRRPQVVIGTPGRLKDLIQQRVLHLQDFSIFVLDEVDLMVDIGFINDIKYFVSLLPKVRQSLFFSATIGPKVQEILREFVKNPITVSVKSQDTAENIDQDVVKIINREKKVDQLHDLLIQDGFQKVLIFGRTKHGIEKLNKELMYRGFRVGAIHGNKSQGQRQRILESFKADQIQILLATDVASRGLDIPNVSHVINYDLPQTYEDYIHRIGRTGRAGKTGIALTFVE